jgi:hypothetical protein
MFFKGVLKMAKHLLIITITSILFKSKKEIENFHSPTRGVSWTPNYMNKHRSTQADKHDYNNQG